MKKSFEQIAEENKRYSSNAVNFVYKSLAHIVKNRQSEPEQTERLHVSGQELCEGLRQLAMQRWGRLAKVVLNHWGVRTTHDFGEIVYLLISNGWMGAQPNDAIEDFDNVYEFKTVFEDQFEFSS